MNFNFEPLSGMKEHAYFFCSCSVLVLIAKNFFCSCSVLVLGVKNFFCSRSVRVLGAQNFFGSRSVRVLRLFCSQIVLDLFGR